MKFLIAGYGSIGRRHFQNLRALGYDDIVFYHTNKGTVSADEIKDYPVEGTLEDALAHKPDSVIISNPTANHLDVAIPAVKAGCHILLEKPISHNMDRVDEFQEAIKKHDARVLVGFQYRFHPGIRRIRRLLVQETIGKPLYVRAHWGEYLPDWHPWEDYTQSYSARDDLGGGVLLTLSHPLDYLHWLLGDVTSVWAMLSKQSALELSGVEDTAELGLQFENGVIGSVHLNYYQRPYSHWLEVIGSEGTLHWNDIEGIVVVYREEDREWKEHDIKSEVQRNDLFLSELKHFVAVALRQFEPICDIKDGIHVQKIINGAK